MKRKASFSKSYYKKQNPPLIILHFSINLSLINLSSISLKLQTVACALKKTEFDSWISTKAFDKLPLYVFDVLLLLTLGEEPLKEHSSVNQWSSNLPVTNGEIFVNISYCRTLPNRGVTSFQITYSAWSCGNEISMFF